MAQQSAPGEGLGTANPVSLSPAEPDKKVEKQEEEWEPQSLEEALLGE
jgi:hypothetical protein